MGDMKRITARRAPWGHISRKRVLCGKVGPRVLWGGLYAHRYCIKATGVVKHAPRPDPTERLIIAEPKPKQTSAEWRRSVKGR
jgi:hypothetical protein